MNKAAKIIIPIVAGLSLGVIGLSVASALKNNGNGGTNSIVDKDKNAIYGFSWKDGEMVRTDQAIGKVAGINGQKNDFDSCYPWSEIKTVYDDGAYWVQVPKFYFQLEDQTLRISGTKHEGFQVAPAFLKADLETELSYFRVGAYEASFTNESHTALTSLPNKQVAAKITMTEARQMAMGAGNYLFDYREMVTLNYLFEVEFATFDSQSVMVGNSYWLDMSAQIEEAGYYTSAHFAVDDYGLIDVETPEEYVTYIKEHKDCSYYDEDSGSYIPFKINNVTYDSEAEDYILTFSSMYLTEGKSIYIGEYVKTGLSTGRKGSSNGSSIQSDVMNYRGIENYYGNFYKWVDGIAYKDAIADADDSLMIGFDPLYYSSLNFDHYEEIKKVSFGGGFTGGLTLAENGIAYPTANDGGDSIDYTNHNYSISNDEIVYYIGYMGGDSNSESGAGCWCLVLDNDASLAVDDYGFRLSQYPFK